MLRCAAIAAVAASAVFTGRLFLSQNHRPSKMELHSTVSCGVREGDNYHLCDAHIHQFREEGMAVLPGFLTEPEVAALELLYDQYMREGSPDKQGKDFCDMSQPFDTPREQYAVINAMLPRRYYPAFKDSIYEQITARVAAQLFPEHSMLLDYDQLLDKAPNASSAVFAWHQDMAYWPPPEVTPQTETVTFSLALDSTDRQNGCIRYVPRSGVQKKLREHVPLGSSREDSHAVVVEVEDDEEIKYAQVPRGSVSIHDEYVVHGSGGNHSPRSRRTYVIAYRALDTVLRERAAGFTHSHNDAVNWDVFNQWRMHTQHSSNLQEAATEQVEIAVELAATLSEEPKLIKSKLGQT